jgi:hypothetical protein
MPPNIGKEIKPEKDAPLYRIALTAAGVSIRNGRRQYTRVPPGYRYTPKSNVVHPKFVFQ